MSAGDHIHHEQFAHHLESIRNNLGVELGRNHMSLPGGLRVPVAGLEMHIRSGGSLIRAGVPDELGNLHHLSVAMREREDHSDRYPHTDRVDFGLRDHPTADSPRRLTNSLTYHLHDFPTLDETRPHQTRDPERFSRQVSEMLSQAVPPTPFMLDRNMAALREHSATSRQGMPVTSAAGEFPNVSHAEFKVDPSTGQVLE